MRIIKAFVLITIPLLIITLSVSIINTLFDSLESQRDRRKRLAKYSYETACLESAMNFCYLRHLKIGNEYYDCLEEALTMCERRATEFSGWVF